MTDDSGYYSVSDLPYGMYTMEISKDLYITKYETIIVGNPLYYNHEYPIIFTPKMNNGELRVVLIWGRNPSDLDSHLISYNEGKQRYFSSIFFWFTILLLSPLCSSSRDNLS